MILDFMQSWNHLMNNGVINLYLKRISKDLSNSITHKKKCTQDIFLCVLCLVSVPPDLENITSRLPHNEAIAKGFDIANSRLIP